MKDISLSKLVRSQCCRASMQTKTERNSGRASPIGARARGIASRRGLLVGTLPVLAFMLVITGARADYVGSLTNRIFLDPDTIPVLIDGYDVGDVISYILETTPRDTGSTTGHAAYMTLYVPAGVEVVGAAFVDAWIGGTYIARDAEDTDDAYDDCGPRGCRSYTPSAGTVQLANGAIHEVQQDTGIFYSTDSRTVISSVGGSLVLIGPPLDPSGALTKPALTYNQWDYDQLEAFGIRNNNGNLSGNDGKGNTPLISSDSGATFAGMGSGVAGPDTFYRNDYSPGCDPGSSAFEDDTQCMGPWQRIAYPNSKTGGSGTPTPSTTNNLNIVNTSILTTAGYVLSESNPLPAGTNAIRWVHGTRTIGDLEFGRVTFRITDVAAFLDSFTDDTFCLESTGSDTRTSPRRTTSGATTSRKPGVLTTSAAQALTRFSSRSARSLTAHPAPRVHSFSPAT